VEPNKRVDALICRELADAPTEEIMSILTERPNGPQKVTPTLTMEVRRNEVWLEVAEADAAVGLDDLMDALALPAA
jgi:hypothetical protein